MIYSVTGNVVDFDVNTVCVDVNGVAFRCMTTLNTISKIGRTGEEATLFTHLNVREDAMDLFGFYTQQELDCFKQLISVSGVGPKAGLAILSQLSPDKLALCIASGDVKSITKAQGVGPKLASRIVLELKDKLKAFGAVETGVELKGIRAINPVTEKETVISTDFPQDMNCFI